MSFHCENKTKVIVILSSRLHRPMPIEHFDICGQVVESSIIVLDHGVVIDADLMVINARRTAFHHL
jgi:hypothetical protein